MTSPATHRSTRLPARALTALITAATIAATAATLTAAENATTSDLLRFSNGDTLHGQFLSFGKNNTLLWKNPESPAPITFSTKKSHRIVLNRGLAHKPLEHTSTVTLVNGDIIPGHIKSASPTHIRLATPHLGTLDIPRNTVTTITLSPFGGKLLYHGSLNQDGWKTITPPEPHKKPDNDKKQKTDTPKTNDTADNTEDPNWKFIAGAWYSGTDKLSHLIRQDTLPDKCKLSFKLAWRHSPLLHIGIHADFAPPTYEGKINTRSHMAAVVGHAYVLKITPHSASLFQCSFQKDGCPVAALVGNTHASLQLSNAQDAHFELRIDRPHKQLLLYINGQFKAKWNLGDHYYGKGNGLSFNHQFYNANSQLRISDIIVSQWNGLTDSAQSMQSRDRDTILLTNGLDRYSGTFRHLRNQTVTFHGSYNSQLAIPANEVREIHLASNKHRQQPDDADLKAVRFYITPHGRISGIPTPGKNGTTTLHSHLLGPLTLDTRYINLIDFSHQNHLLDLWDDQF